MEDEVALILLESSYSLLELSIRARKKGLDREGRCILFLIFGGYDMVDARSLTPFRKVDSDLFTLIV